ncbi:MAG: hemolysin III family protein [Deinococcota bacterium]|jgi:hemolysin III|nr:hemolysin III family protein [Deinococcota bacterium]
MAAKDLPPIRPWYIREPISGFSHLAGVLLSIIGLVVLLVLSAGEPWRTTSFAVYGVTLILLYTASTLYHSLHVRERWVAWLKAFDHSAIYALIAGTYTPITLVTLQSQSPAWGWTLFGLAWGCALLGIIVKLVWLGAPRWLSTGLYLVMGWMSLIAIVPIIQTLAGGGLFWMLAGGFFYTAGAVIYGLKRPNLVPGVFGYHELWHFFVLAGSISHFFMMLFYILPA